MPKKRKKKSSKSKATWAAPNMGGMRKAAKRSRKRRESRKSGGSFWSPQPNTRSVIRILPSWSTRAAKVGRFWLEIYKYWNLPIKDLKGIISPVHSFPEQFDEDPLDKTIARLDKMGVSTKNCYPQGKVHCNIILVKEGKTKVGERKIAQMPQGFGAWLEQQILEDEEGLDFTCPEGGVDIRVKREGSGKNDTKYEYTFVRKSDPVDLALLEGMPDLDKKFAVSDEDMAKIRKGAKELLQWGKAQSQDEDEEDFEDDDNDEEEYDEDEDEEYDEDDDEEDEDEDEDDFDDDEDEDEDEDEEDFEDDDDDDDDDEDDEDDEEEEEEEPPKRKKRKSSKKKKSKPKAKKKKRRR
jgi:hypothetical protein